jgi:hypothetical protein
MGTARSSASGVILNFEMEREQEGPVKINEDK